MYLWTVRFLRISVHTYRLYTEYSGDSSVDYNGRSSAICRATYTNGRALAPWSDIVAGQANTCARATVKRS